MELPVRSDQLRDRLRLENPLNIFTKALLVAVGMGVVGGAVAAMLVATGVPQWLATAVGVSLVVAAVLYVLRNGEGWDP